MQRRRSRLNKDCALLLIAMCFLAGSEKGIATPKLRVDTTAHSEVRLLVDSDFHTRFGLAFPVTYQIGIPRGVTGLTASIRHDTTAAWMPLPTKTSADFFNDTEAARFDTSEERAYVSASFAPGSDFLAIRITDSAGTPIELSYKGIARYYDNRNAAVLVSIDDWKAMTDSLFRHATTVLRAYDLAITAAIITSDCEESTWQHLQDELNAGSFEAASHTRTHARWPYTDIVSQVQGSRQDILSRLTLPSLYRKGNQEYVYSFLVPFGETSAEIEEAVSQGGYLVSRLVGSSNGDFAAWNPQVYRYNADGTTMEMGPPWGSTSSAELNAKFDSTVQAGHIYHLLMHPYTLGQTDEWSQPYVTEHLSHISQRTDIWYATLGQVYVYHLVGDTATEQTSPPEVPLTVTLNPSDVTVVEGESASFQVLAIGNPPLAYQWHKDFLPISGATDPTLVTGPTTTSDDGSTFQCAISNSTGSIVSSRALLAVSDSALPVGDNLVVNPGFEEGTEDWTFHTETSGAFHTEVAGYESPRAGTITIGSPASNIQLYQTGFPLVAGKQYRLSFQAYSNSGRNLSVTVQRHSSPYTVLGLSLTEFDISSTWQSFSIEFTATGFTETTSDTRLRFWFAPYAQTGDQYFIDNVTLEELSAGDRPTITIHPVTQTVCVGERVEFSVSASGPSPLQYQWQRDLVEIPAATNSVYSLSPVTPADSGARFRCIVTNPYGTAASAQAILHVQPIDSAQGGAVRVVVLGSSTAEGEAARPLSNAWANRYRDYLQSSNPGSELFNLAIGGFTTFNVMPSGYVPPSPWNTSEYAPVNTNNITYALALQPTLIIINLPTNDCASYIPVSVQMNNYERIIAEAGAHNVPVWITSPQGRNVDQAGRSLLLQLRAATEAYYPDRVIDFWTDLADSVGFILPEFNFDNTHLNNAGHAVLYDRVVSTVRWRSDVTPPQILSGPQPATRLEGDSVVFTITLQGTRPFAYRWQRNGVEIGGAIDSIYVLPSITRSDSGATFRAIVRNTAGSDTSEEAMLDVSPVIPATITAEPLDTTALSGQSARFAVAASGTEPLTYRWQRNGLDIAGATDSVYTLAAIAQVDSGATFRTIVSNRGGSDTSKAAILRVLPLIPATITAEPLDNTFLVGQSARFAVSASGTAPLSYRWQRDTLDIEGGNDSIYVLPAVTLADSGATFRVIVSNAGGSDTSEAAVLRVVPEFLGAVVVPLKVFLQGPYSGDTMSTALRVAGLIPLEQPYAVSPWDYPGVESIEEIPADVVDWVLLELRTGAVAPSRAATRAAFVKSDGTVVGLDGRSAVTFDSVAAGDYYIVLHHRNHLAVMSAHAAPLSVSSGLYDFTVAGNAYGTNAMVDLGGGVFGMCAGNSDGNTAITVVDYNAAGSKIFLGGYLPGDHDMNGIVTVLDYNLVGLNIFKSSHVP
jgi:lysophospholipase L1-like esterase